MGAFFIVTANQMELRNMGTSVYTALSMNLNFIKMGVDLGED